MKNDDAYAIVNGPYRYTLQLTCQHNALLLTLTQPLLVDSWAVTYQSTYIQEITAKTGQRILFQRFCQLLAQVLAAPTQHNYAEVLSSMDIETMKAKKTGQQVSSSVVVTLTIGGAKYHYPLAMNAKQSQQESSLLTGIAKLQENIHRQGKETSISSVMDKSSSTDFEADQIKRENEILKSEIGVIERRESLRRGAVELDLIIKSKLEIKSKIANLERDKGKIIVRLRNTVVTREKELNTLNAELQAIRRQTEKAENNDPNAMNRLRNYAMKAIKITQFQINSIKKLITKLNREKANLQRKIQQNKNAEKKSNAKIKQIQLNIENAKKTLNQKEVAARLSKGTSSVGSAASNFTSISKGVSRPAGTRSQKEKSQKSQSSKPRSNVSYNPKAYNRAPPRVNLVRTGSEGSEKGELRRTAPQGIKKPEIPRNYNKANTLVRPVQPVQPVQQQPRPSPTRSRPFQQPVVPSSKPVANRSVVSGSRKPYSVVSGGGSSSVGKDKQKIGKVGLGYRKERVEKGRGGIESKLDHLGSLIQRAKR